MFCVNCGKSYDTTHKFCNHCGHSVAPESPIEEPLALEEPAVSLVTEDGGEPTPPHDLVEPSPVHLQAMASLASDPLVPFVLYTLGTILAFSVLVFDTGQWVVLGRWNTAIADVLALVAVLLLGRKAYSLWCAVSVVGQVDDATVRTRHARLLRNSTIIALLFLAAAGSVGAAIGKSRDEAIQLATDLERMKVLGSRISDRRNGATASIASYSAMYEAIGSDVQDLESTLLRIKEELQVYDNKFPAQHATTATSMAAMDQSLKRMAILKKQAALMKVIQQQSVGDQLVTWKTEMMPLASEEDALNEPKP